MKYILDIKMRYLILGLILTNLLVYYIIFDFIFSKNLVSFLNIGQGSSVLIKDKNNIILYDTGKYPSLLFKNLDSFIPFYNKKIDLILISHSDEDHYFSLFEVLKRYKIRAFILPEYSQKDEKLSKLIKEVEKIKIPIIYLKRGDKIFTKNYNFIILHPEKIYKKENDNSLVIKVIGKNSYLLTGDIEKEAIKSIILCCRNYLKSDFLLYPHHGSRYSLYPEFYYLTNPKIVIIQVGKNYYGHPHKEVIDFLKSKNFSIWRTDIQNILTINE